MFIALHRPEELDNTPNGNGYTISILAVGDF